MQYYKLREVLANDSGITDEHIVGRNDDMSYEEWLNNEFSDDQKALTEAESKILGHWYYDGERDAFLVDRAAAAFIGATDHHDAQSPHVVVRNLSSFEATRFYLNMNENSMGDVIFEHSTMADGPYKGRSFVIQGSVLQRRPDGTALYATGYISFEHSPHSELIPREISGDGMYIWDSATNELVCSASYHALIGYKEEEFPRYIDDFIARIVHPDDNDFFMVLSHMCQSEQYGDYFESCMRIRHKKGHYLWCVCRGLVQERDSFGRARRVIGTLTNINLVQSSFDNIKLMMFTDSLTGLHNRNYFLQNYTRYEDLDVQPVSVIFIDISGLKLTNDILGHSYGDYLLIKARDLIKDGIAASSYAEHIAKHNAGISERIKKYQAQRQQQAQEIIPGTEALTDVPLNRPVALTPNLEALTSDKPVLEGNLLDQINASESESEPGNKLFDILREVQADTASPLDAEALAAAEAAKAAADAAKAAAHQQANTIATGIQGEEGQKLAQGGYLLDKNETEPVEGVLHQSNDADMQEASVEIMRLAGDEFLVILPYCDEAHAEEIAYNIDRLREENNEYHRLNSPIETGPVPIFFGMGLGTYHGTEADNGRSLKDVIDMADELMQNNKDERRDEFYSQLKVYFERKKGRPVSMRDDRRVTILTEEQRAQMRTDPSA